MGRKLISKLILFVLNTVYFLAAVAILVIGSLSLSGDAVIIDMLALIDDSITSLQYVIDVQQLTVAAAIYFVVLGSLAVLLSFLGCFGALKERRFLLALFGISKLCIILFNLALIMYNSIVPYHGKPHIQSLMKENLEKNFVPMSIDDNGDILYPPANQSAWYWAEMELKQSCCGAENYIDYSDIVYKYANNSDYMGNATVSATCCMQVVQYNIAKLPSNTDEFVDMQRCLTNAPSYANAHGCVDYVMSVIINYRQVYILTAAAFIVLEVLTIALTIRVSDDKRSSVGTV